MSLLLKRGKQKPAAAPLQLRRIETAVARNPAKGIK
jgi:hypothetical protein